MPLSIAYVNEVLNQFPSTVLFDEPEWTEVVQALKFEGRSLEQCTLGRMRLRRVLGGYDGLLAQLEALNKEIAELRAQVEALTAPQSESRVAGEVVEHAPAIS